MALLLVEDWSEMLPQKRALDLTRSV